MLRLNRNPAVPIVLVSLLIATMTPVVATTLRPMQLQEIVSRADRIVHARAVSQRVYWDDAGRRIWTDTTFEVLDDIKGGGPRQVTVTMPGGRIGSIAMVADGTPRFTIDGEVILFTAPRPDGRKNLIGFSQGYLAIRLDPATGDKVVTGLGRRSMRSLPVTGGPADHSRPRALLSHVLADLRALVATGSAGKEAGDLDSVPNAVLTERGQP